MVVGTRSAAGRLSALFRPGERQALSADGDQGSVPRSSTQAWHQASRPFQHPLGKAAQLAGTRRGGPSLRSFGNIPRASSQI